VQYITYAEGVVKITYKSCCWVYWCYRSADRSRCSSNYCDCLPHERCHPTTNILKL